MGNEHKLVAIIKMISTIVGIGFIIWAAYIFFHVKVIVPKYDRVPAQIVNITESISYHRHRTHQVYVSYEYNGHTYNNVSYNSYRSSMYIGQTINVYVNPATPGRAESESLTPVVVLVPIAIFLLYYGRRLSNALGRSTSTKQIKELQKNGLRINATIVSIEENRNVKLNHKSPFRIHCKYEDPATGFAHLFVSNNIWGFEKDVFAPGSTIPVYVDRNDYSKYFVDYSAALSLQYHTNNV